MTQKPISREYRIYLALWRKALKSPEPVRVKASSFSMAVAMRQGMYRAVRPFRNGQLLDKELQEAAEKYVVYMERQDSKDQPHWLVLNTRKALAELDIMFDELGIDEEDLLLSDERRIQDSLSSLMDSEPAQPKITPFYSRD
jgi:hypothetical protein